MDGKQIKISGNTYFWVISLALVSVSLLFLHLYRNKFQEYEATINNYISHRQYELSENLLNDTNPKATEDAFMVLQAYNISAYQVELYGSVKYSWPKSEEIEPGKKDAASIIKSCEYLVRTPLTRFGAIAVGEVKSCLSSSAIAKSTFTTTEFLIVLLLATGALVLPLFNYKRSLNSTMATAEEWSKNPRNTLRIESNDPTTNRIMSFVQQGIDSRMELNEVKSQLQIEKEISRVIKQVAHDIRDPINSLVSNFRIVSENLPDKNISKILNYSVERIESTFNDILKTNRHKSPQSNPVQVADIIPLVNALFDDKRNIHKDVDFKVSAPERIKAVCNPEDLKRVLNNIVNNSIESLDKNKKQISCSLKVENGSAQLILEDNGCGISAENIKKVFDEDFTFGKENGNGLGLSYAANKVKAWGGDISISSDIGVGTRINVTLSNALT